jgi:hypothetical protein
MTLFDNGTRVDTVGVTDDVIVADVTVDVDADTV